MKEYIEREEAERVAMYVAVEKDHAKELIQRIPAADVVEVVRCKDCVCGYKTQNGQIICKFLEAGNFIPYVKPNDYCSYGERADELDSCGKKGE